VQDRLDDLAALGPAGMAAKRAARLCAPDARPEVVAEVQAIMGRVRPRGYAQASALLAQGDILADVPHIGVPTQVLVGGADVITPADKCRAVAARIPGARFAILPAVGHACYLEDPAGFNAALAAFLGAVP
jgi:pimeloyl-ACP methyl ester carboxylesterase